MQVKSFVHQNFFAIILVVLMLFFWVQAGADNLDIIREKNITLINSNCQATDSCDLDRITLKLFDYRIELLENDYNFGTELVAQYDTKQIDQLENYAFVSFIKGCRFDSFLNTSGEVSKTTVGYGLQSFDDIIPFALDQWIIDSEDKDPTYATDTPNSPRHYYYYWTPYPGNYDQLNRRLYGEQKPETPSLFVNYLANQAFYDRENDYAINNSTKHKMCLYKTKDIPVETVRTDLEFGKPLFCYEWISSWVWNFAEQKFENHEDVDPICSQQFQ